MRKDIAEEETTSYFLHDVGVEFGVDLLFHDTCTESSGFQSLSSSAILLSTLSSLFS